MPYWRLSSFYLFFFASLGALMPYWSLYLDYLGFSPHEIGELIAIILATKIISPNVWAWIADHAGRRMVFVRAATILATLAFGGVFFGHSYLWLAAVMALFAFFWNATLPQVEATTLNHLGEETQRYSRIRLWGSIGFIASVAGLGPFLDRDGPALLPTVLFLLLVAISCSSFLVPEREAPRWSKEYVSLAAVLKRPEVLGLIVVCFLMQASHGPYYTFFSIYMQEHHYSRSVIGQLWAIGVIAEVGVFTVMHRLVPRFGLRRLLLASLLFAVVRWCLIAQGVESIALMLLAQVLHAATFGVYHSSAIQLIHKYFVGPHQGRGQALYSSLSFGAGGAFGSLYSGYTWQELGAGGTYMIASVIAALAWIYAWLVIRD